MTPRLKKNGPWTPFPLELKDHICEVFTERFSEDYDIEGFHFVADGRIYNSEILLRVGLNNPNQLKQHNFELSVQYDDEKQKALEVIQESLNTIEPSFVDLLEDDFEDKDFELQWAPVEGAKHMAHLRYSTVNTELEQQADEILNTYEKKLVYGDDDNEEDDTLEELLH